jgi:RNA polymerase-binding transcription factor DksA
MERETARQLLEAERQMAESVASAERTTLGQATDEIFDELASVDQHQADSASETYEREQALTILRVAEERQADIEHALEKVTAGTFGRCETCLEPIDDDRLEARPDARFCASHQRDWELGRLGLKVPTLPGSPSEPADPGWRELDLLPDDDEPVPRPPTLSAEEAAVHLEPTDDELDTDES